MPLRGCRCTATSKGFHWVQRIPRQGYHKPGHFARVDHAAIHHASKYGGDHGIH